MFYELLLSLLGSELQRSQIDQAALRDAKLKPTRLRSSDLHAGTHCNRS